MEHAAITPGQYGESSLLLCATDAGGVRNIAALCSSAKEQGFEIHIVTRRSLASLFQDSNIMLVENLAGGIKPFLRKLQPGVVICGTTRYDSPDRETIAFARMRGVPCVAVVDEWYNYILRFSGRDGEELPVFPDAIAVPDEFARREAIAEGVPREICHATGSPSLALVADLAELWHKFPPAVPKELSGLDGATIVTFVSETHYSDYGMAPGESGPLGPFIGYTEQSVCRSILQTLGGIPKKFVFVYRPHPSESEFPEPTPLPDNIQFLLAPGAPLLPLCYHSDMVIGMRSMAILEAKLIGCRAASFQPGLVGPQLSTAVRLGLVPFLMDENSLSAWISENSLKSGRRESASRRPDFARPDAADNILSLAMQKILH